MVVDAVGSEGRGITLTVDARGLRASGIGRYLREVLAFVMSDSRFGNVTLLGDPPEVNRWLDSTPHAVESRVVPFDHPFYSPSSQLHWLALRASAQIDTDAYFFPHYDGPVVGLPRRSLVTVQDLIHFKVPEAFPRGKRIAAGLMLRRVCRQAGRIVVTSEATREDLEDRLPFTASKTVVIPLGISAAFAPEGVNGKRGPVEPPFILCVGNQKAHKNQVAAVETLARLRARWPELRLVLAGRAYEGTELVRERARRLDVEESVVEIVEPDDEQLLQLYRSCGALLFPSLYEGFGLPVLEAMSAGAPVVAANTSSIPEVAGEAAILVGPHDYDAMASATARLLDDDRHRSEILQAGARRARQFSWTDTAQRIADELAAIGRAGARRATARSGQGSGDPKRERVGQ